MSGDNTNKDFSMISNTHFINHLKTKTNKIEESINQKLLENGIRQTLPSTSNMTKEEQNNLYSLLNSLLSKCETLSSTQPKSTIENDELLDDMHIEMEDLKSLLRTTQEENDLLKLQLLSKRNTVNDIMVAEREALSTRERIIYDKQMNGIWLHFTAWKTLLILASIKPKEGSYDFNADKTIDVICKKLGIDQNDIASGVHKIQTVVRLIPQMEKVFGTNAVH